MGAASLRHAPLPISHHFHGCTALLRFVKWRYIKYQGFTFFKYIITINLLVVPVHQRLYLVSDQAAKKMIVTIIAAYISDLLYRVGQNIRGL